MSSFKGKLKEVFKKGDGEDRKPGSSTARAAKAAAEVEAANAAATAKAAKSVQDFVTKVKDLASGTVSGVEHVRELVGTIGNVDGKANFTVSGSSSGRIWVGLQGNSGNRVTFTAAERNVVAPKYCIPYTSVVPMIYSQNLDIRGNENGQLGSMMFKRGDYTELDLAAVSRANCLFVLTSQLSGCTFAIGRRGNMLYMGHAKSNGQVKFADTGKVVLENLVEKRETMFQRQENLESTFLVGFGSEFKIEETRGIITYDAFNQYANVIGLVCNHKIYFIVAVERKLNREILNVVLVTQETGTGIWRTENHRRA